MTTRTAKTIRVTITKELRLEIDDAHLTPEALKEFSESIYMVSTPLEIFECAAQQIARFEAGFVEGVGTAVTDHGQNCDLAAVVWAEISEEVETEEVRP